MPSMNEPKQFIQVELAYLTPTQQYLAKFSLPVGAIIRQLLEVAKLADIDLDSLVSGQLRNTAGLPLGLGVFAKARALDSTLAAGDRVEIYRPLPKSPNQLRLERQAGKLAGCHTSEV